MDPKVLMVVGVPGSGKSSLVRALTDTLSYSIVKKPFWHTVYYDQSNAVVGSQFGWTPEYGDGAKFGGTDRLAFDVINNATRYMKLRDYANVIVEGDRLSNSRFIDGAMAAGYGVELVEVTIHPDIAKQRREERGQQDPVWVLTRMQKVANLIKEYEPWMVAQVEGTIDHDEQLRQLAERSIVVRHFMEAR